MLSGYSNHPIVAEYKDYVFMGTLSKPFRMQELSKGEGQGEGGVKSVFSFKLAYFLPLI